MQERESFASPGDARENLVLMSNTLLEREGLNNNLKDSKPGFVQFL